MKQPAIYINNGKQSQWYDLYRRDQQSAKRVYEHKNAITKGFTEKYKCKHLVYYEVFRNMESAIEREKQIKADSRKKKLLLIERMNPGWKDLYEDIL